MRQQSLHALTHMIAFCAQGANFLLKLIKKRSLIAKLRFSPGSAFLRFHAGSALTFDELDGAYDALFQRGKVIGA